MKKILFLHLIVCLLALNSCRREQGNSQIPSNKKIYLKSFTISEDGDFEQFKPIYDANNKVTSIENYIGNIPSSFQMLATTVQLIWETPTQLRMNNVYGANTYAIFTIPPNNVEENRMPTSIEVYENQVLENRISISSTQGQSFAQSIDITKESLQPTYSAFVEIIGSTYKSIYTYYETATGNLSTQLKNEYTLSNKANKTFNTCRELYWFLMIWKRDELEEDATSPYWQSLTLPENVAVSEYNTATQTWVPLSNYSYTTTYSAAPFNEYLSRIELPAPNTDQVFQSWEWETR
jgi:hypothetical protein